jgi:hypothetical protein
LINSIKRTKDESLIDEMYNLLNEGEITDIQLDVLPDELKLKLSRAMEDYKQGRYITHDQMKLKIQQWLMK